MKALLYKEFKLAMHPICYLFVALFPFMILIPDYPVAIGFIYVLSCYPVLFLGANKGQQSNDLLFSTLLPVRKKDIVLARLITVMIMQFAFILIMSALYPLALIIPRNSNYDLGLKGFVSTIAIALIGYAIADLIFFLVYYKHGKSIVMSTLLTIFGFIFHLFLFTIIIPSLPGCEWYRNIFKGEIWIQFIILGVVLIAYFFIHLLVHKLASKELENVDF